MKLTRTMLVLGVCLLAIAAAQVFELPNAKVTVRVRDQDGNPVPSASLRITGDSAGLKQNPETDKAGASDRDGLFDTELKSRGEIWITAEKAGYYRSEGLAYNYRSIPNELDRAFSRKRWEPWNPTVDVILKRVINPIPMYARIMRKGLPPNVERVGFDLVEGDFTPPNGRGKVADLIFTPVVEDRGRNDYDLKINVTFSSAKDGITQFAVLPPLRGSVLRSPHQAPDSGYLAEWMVWRSRRPNTPEWSNYDPVNHAYFIRVRTVVDEKGNIVSANYGKIYGDFMNITYYLNPKPNDRNVEFDPTRNLLRLKEDDLVSDP
jgi:hypothetical protein